MPKINLEPLIKLSKEQMKVMFERLITKEGTPSRSAVEEIMKYAPPEEKTVGTLFSPGVKKGMGVTEKLPIDQARQKYFANPEQFTPGQGAPSAKVLRQAVPGEPAEIGGGMSYERVKQMPVNTPKAQAEHLMTTPVAEIMGNEAHASRIWAITGGGRSVSGHMWEQLRKSSRQSAHIDDAKDYFKSSFIRWRENPAHFKKNYPREDKLLNETWEKYGIDLPEGVAR